MGKEANMLWSHLNRMLLDGHTQGRGRENEVDVVWMGHGGWNGLTSDIRSPMP